MKSLTLPLLIAALALGGCGRLADSRLNPANWASGRAAPTSLEPEGGYVAREQLPLVPQLLGAEWQPLNEGRLLVVRGFAPRKGYHSARLVTTRLQPGSRLAPDADGILRLRFVAVPPAEGDPAAALPAAPATDTITVALPFSFTQLNRLRAVEITGADRVLTLSR
jgi:hypothetical protein